MVQRGDDEVPQSTKYRKVDSESLGPNGIDPGYLTAGKSTGNWGRGVDAELTRGYVNEMQPILWLGLGMLA